MPSGAVLDLAGNRYAGSSSYDFTTVKPDTTAPTVSRFSPTDGATNVAVGSNVVLTFSEAIDRGTGTITLRSGSASGTIVESFDAATSSRISISGSTLTLDPTNNLTGNTSYYVTLTSGSVTDLAGNSYTGTTSYDFRTAAPAPLTLTGTSGANTLTGGGGNDILDGKAGVDIMDGGEGSDIYIIGAASEHPAAEIADTGTSGLDELRFAATAASTLVLHAGDTGLESVVIGTGTKAAATTTGTTALNVDASALDYGILIIGNAGANILTGGAGNDRLQGGNGNDTLRGGAGYDYADYSTATKSVTVNLNISTAQNTGGAGTDILTDIESIFGGNAADNLTGSAGNNTLFGDAGNDIISGGNGLDLLIGGAGKDTLTGGEGMDWFVFETAPNASSNLDTITDFTPGTDKLVFSKSIFAGLELGDLTSDAFWAGAGVKTAHDASDRLIYNTSTGALYYDADGAGGSAAIQVALLGTSMHPLLSYTDISISVI